MTLKRYILCLLSLCATSVLAPSAFADTNGPGWEVTAGTLPTNVPPGGSAVIYVNLFDVGAADTTGNITVTDALPKGLTAVEAGTFHEAAVSQEPQYWDCTIAPGSEENSVVSCANDPGNLPVFPGGGGIEGRFEGGSVTPQIGIAVHASEGATGSPLNRVTVAGGGAAAAATATNPVMITATPAGFGVAVWDGWFSNADGTIDTQAGSHPYAATFSLAFDVDEINGRFPPAGSEVRSVAVELPPGLVGDPTAVPQCPRELFDPGPGQAIDCPADTQVGVSQSKIFKWRATDEEPIYNLVPPPGVAASFGFGLVSNNGFLDSSPRTGGDYGITTRSANIPEGRGIVGATLTFWGVPGDPSHDPWRCNRESCTPSGAGQKPFLTLPTACAGPQKFTVHMNEWSHPDVAAERSFESHDSNGDPVGVAGCEHLGFGPNITTEPDTVKADTPAGLTVDVAPPVGGLSLAGGLSTSDIQKATVVLPEGLVINPGQAAGLQACQETAEQSAIGTERAPNCPLASKVGTVTIRSPLIEGGAEKQFEGDVYVLQSDPPELKLLVAASADGVNLKLVGIVHLNETTGRLTTTFGEQPEVEANDPFLKGHLRLPELPFTDFKLSFSGGAQAALDTPTQCGTDATTSHFAPWSSPFIADAFPTGPFAITEGPSATPCPPNPMPFAPTMTAGSTTDQAGGFTNFSLLLQRGDGQQRIEKLQFREPAGLAGLISSVPLCGEADANAGTCPAASHIGHAVVASGPGPYPLVLPQPGAPELPIYLTGPYNGAPFGLSIVTPVIAGPFNLGTIVTRAKIEVDPRTAQITITTDPLPQVVKGVPTDLRSINSIIDRPGFLFNPTNCTPASFAGTAWGTPPPGAGGPGATAPISSHFGVGSCRSLAFTPKLGVSTAAKTSKANGASLSFKISYPKGALGSQSWFQEAKFDLPKQLPARLTTLQKACLASVFESNPANCPPASLIGHAIVHTQVLPVPLAGPVYFVSYGGAKFPEAVIVLQGDGVLVDLHGETFISKAGITSATFRNTPDVPFENIEVTVPSGPFSEFAANLPPKAHGSLCGQKLVMPTLFKAQNGLEIHQNTNIAITGCAKAKKPTRAQQLTAALKACKKKAKSKRAACIRQAHRKYGPIKEKKKK